MPEKVTLALYNTESRQKEPVHPLDGETVKLYTCGPTIYNFAHIGNFRTYIFEDLLRRTLKYFGYKVIQVMNLTDVDDKTIKGAVAKGLSLETFTTPFKEAFFEDLKTLNIEPAESYPAATDHIPEMIAMIKTLVEKGIAYQGQDKSIYFRISKFPSYGRLSHLNLEELEAGASERSVLDEYEKEEVSDFVLWKAYDQKRDGEVFWESPFGKGRPGWHIECSAMAIKHLGPEIDIHCGGIDNMFPHHENEIAQSEACTEKHFVRHWLHSEHLLVNQKKMSKSLGNFYTLRDLLKKGFSGREIRYLLLQTHYKTQLNFTFEGLEAAKKTLRRLDDFIERLQGIKNRENQGLFGDLLQKANEGFTGGLSDDLNISVSLAALFDLVREINSLIDENRLGDEEARQIIARLRDFDTVLGVLTFEKEDLEIPEEIREALEKREEARKAKNWKEADYFRDFIQMRGFLIIDTPQGVTLKKK